MFVQKPVIEDGEKHRLPGNLWSISYEELGPRYGNSSNLPLNAQYRNTWGLDMPGAWNSVY